MKIAIHHSPGSFSDRWIEFCEQNKIPFKLVNCYKSDIIDQLQDCETLMWHYHHADYKDVLFAKQLLFSLEQAGKKVFPDFNTAWHFDDKVGQKYLLESIGAPLVPSYVFYTKQEAFEWINTTSFPKVFKLRGGAGSANVKLVKSKQAASKLTKKAFGKGFPQYNKWESLNERINKYIKKQVPFFEIIKGLMRLIIPTTFSKMHGREKGYVYFQNYIPYNDSDIRVIVVDEKAFAIKRMVRANDFRASGSGNIIYDRSHIDERCVRISFEINKKIKSQSIAYDFVFDGKNNPLIVEISYGYAVGPYDLCPGYWSSDLVWHAGKFNPQGWMVETLI